MAKALTNKLLPAKLKNAYSLFHSKFNNTEKIASFVKLEAPTPSKIPANKQSLMSSGSKFSSISRKKHKLKVKIEKYNFIQLMKGSV